MIPTKNIILSGSIQNPDSSTIRNKRIVDISLSDFDVSASQAKVSANLVTNIITVHPTVTGSSDIAELYFTPIYKEKINYNEWKTTVNKQFTELETR